ncbi:MAG TPA: IPT/TIG domain-containing protein [Acidimicrobiales bacterium]|nr:IPT/TIG domain-containing protein [Acidimicrobiales bacterium]
MTAITTTTSSRLSSRLVAVAAAVGLLASTAPQWAPDLARVLPGPSSSLATPAADRLSPPRIAPAFEANLGQFDPEVAFVARAGGHDLFLTPTEAVVSLRGAPGGNSKPAVVRIRPAGGRAVPANELVAGRRRPGSVNYLIGNDPSKWQRNVARYGAVTYPSVYPGIDLVYHSGKKGLEYDYVVAPGADPGVIAVEVEGATGLRVEGGGDLVADTSAGALRQAKPVAYQHKGSEREPVRGTWRLDGGSTARFRLGPYDHTRELVIDPVLVYSSYLGGSGLSFGTNKGEDRVTSVAVDAGGHAYLTGSTTAIDFPTHPPEQAYQDGSPKLSMNQAIEESAFVAKMGLDGTELVWATYLGSPTGEVQGASSDVGKAVAVDSEGAAHVVALTTSSKFPVLKGSSFAATCGCTGEEDTGRTPMVVTVKLAPDGTDLAWSTYLGPAAAQMPHEASRFVRAGLAGLALDSSGSAYVSSAAGPNFPTTDATTCEGCRAPGFVVKLDTAGLKQFGTYLDGAGAGIAVSPEETRLYLAGARDGDAYVAALDSSGSLAWERSLGGSGQDRAAAVAVGPGGQVFLAGTTTSPVFAAPTVFSNECGRGEGESCAEAFVAEIEPLGGIPAWARYLGGRGGDEAAAVAVDSSGAPWVVGTTDSDDFPVLNPVQGTLLGDRAAFVARVSPGGSALVESTYLGGTRDAGFFDPYNQQEPKVVVKTEAAGIAVDAAGAAYVVGSTTAADYPVHGAFQDTSAQGISDGFVTKLAPAAADLPLVVGAAPRRGRTSGGTAVTIRGERLGGAQALHFGEALVPCPSPNCEVRSPNEIRAITPPHPRGEALVRVTTPAGTSPPNPVARFAYTAGSWDAVADPGGGVAPRIKPVAVLLGDGRVLVAGGCCDDEGEGLASSQLFDPRTANWSGAAPMHFGRKYVGRHPIVPNEGPGYGPSAVLLTGPRCGQDCGKVLVAGGAVDDVIAQPGSFRESTVRERVTPELYDPKTDTWEKLHLNDDVDMGMAMMLEDGRVLFIGGRPTWVQPLETEPCHPERPIEVCLLNPLKARHMEYRPWFYDPATRTWSEAAPEGYWRGSGEGTATRLPSGKVLVTGGKNPPDNAQSSDRLGENCPGGNFCQAPPQVFDPSPLGSPGSWSPAGSAVGNVAAGATLLAGPPEACGANCGKVLVTGGTPDVNGHSLALAEAELFDPAAAAGDAWEATGSMVGPTYLHQSTLLPDGTVLVAGGAARHGRSTSSVFDPRDVQGHPLGRWFEAGDLLAPRSKKEPNTQSVSRHRAVVLSSHPTRFEADPAVCGANCGKVLVVGGNDSEADGDPIGPTSELYTPSPTVRALTPAAAPEGAIVTIRGTGFTNVGAGQKPKVSFGGVEASNVNVVSYDTLTAVVPTMSDRRVVDVTVTSQGGRSEAEAPSRFTYVGVPGFVRNVVATAISDTAATLSFDAAGIIGDVAPPATDYQVRFSRAPIPDLAAFDAARPLCPNAVCSFVPGSVGQRLNLDVGGLRPGTTYYFAVRALGPGGGLGPLSDQASTRTSGVAPLEDVVDQAVACAGQPGPGASQVAYPGSRYSLVGGPTGTVVGAGSPLYSWFDLGARGEYAVASGDAGLQAGRGYWAWFACPKLVDLGPGQDSVAFALGAYRASMVANPSGRSLATVSGHDFAARWNPDANGGAGAYEMSGYRAPQTLALGEGAWVFSYVPTEVRIQATP